MTSEKLMAIYNALFKRYGPQHWWPGQSRFEIIIGAILTQNTAWINVEKAIANLNKAGLLEPHKLHRVDTLRLAECIRPAGYYNIKAHRIKSFLNWLFENYNGDLDAIEKISTSILREALLGIKGIGPETADSILLYAFARAVFVVDAYTARVMVRHRLIDAGISYDSLQELFTANLPADAGMFNEYHALLVQVGKDHCRKRARCSGCPLEDMPHDASDGF